MTVQDKPARTQGPTVSQQIADWAAQLGPQDVPEAMRAAAANTMLDTIGLSIAAWDTDYGQALRSSALSSGGCTVMGTSERRDAFEAALINGTTAHGEDFDNTFEGCPVHSGAVIVPAVFAAGEAHGLSAARVALGVAAGMELMCRLGVVAQKGVHAQGFHPTSVLGTMGAALGVSVARVLDAAQTVNALGLAGSMASGIIEYLADGTWTKRMHAGWAAQAGIRAAAMGAAGFLGPVSVFEGTHGLYKAFAPSVTPDFSILTEGLGSRWVSADVAFKPYACGTMTQPYIDCAVRLAQRGVDLDAIERITCKVGHGTVHRLWEPLALKQSPPTPYAAKFSGPYTVAAGLVWQDAGLAQFTEEALADPRAAALARKVAFIVDPDNEYPANYTGDVALHMKSGELIEEHQPQMRGGLRQPMTRDDLVRKCAANLKFGGWQGMDAEEIATMVDAMFTSEADFSAGAFGR
ncbi:MmgE/PrpD family protein [Alkalilacustris brevis]|uniref:MmgE/PrpD family protein n=1 Tax=Alkalilacustris brevis TaxID=2026338 RepID=UPI000E0DD05F|nr:MmgE/PrpD family protein [Alkalilacustris brevis]